MRGSVRLGKSSMSKLATFLLSALRVCTLLICLVWALLVVSWVTLMAAEGLIRYGKSGRYSPVFSPERQRLPPVSVPGQRTMLLSMRVYSQANSLPETHR
jgi:hypothetical protein